MIEIDGGTAGGQLLRSALALSGLTNRAFHMRDIRGGRATPGLRPQHLAAVMLMADICNADVSDIAVGTSDLTFQPTQISPGEYTTDIGTAGSITLLFDTVLPLCLRTTDSIVITARGGTDVKWAPTITYFGEMKLRLLRQHGVHGVVECNRPGFYPEGGGNAILSLAPSHLSPITLDSRDRITGVRVYSSASSDLADRSVAERQAETAIDQLATTDVHTLERVVRYADAESPGSSILIHVVGENIWAGFEALGERGRPAENVANNAADQTTRFIENSTATVDRHLADQLMLFLAIAGGRVRIPKITDHIRTNRDVITAFNLTIDIDRTNETPVLTSPGNPNFLE